MASGKESPRQKMINLMYLVFIAMLAMNMSKEVLSAFGFMNDKLVKSNISTTTKNDAAYKGLAAKASEQAAKYGALYTKANKVREASASLYNFIADLKTQMTADLDDLSDFEAMDKTEFLDENFFVGDGYSPLGQEFVDKINAYRTLVTTELADRSELVAVVNERFKIGDETTRDGATRPWLDYHYKGFPLVASLTNLTQIQADVKATEADMLSTLLQGQLSSDVSMTNYDAMVVFDKNAYYAGEELTGKIVLGKNDPTLLAEKVVLNGKEVEKSQIQAGQVILSGSAGAVGDHTLKGSFYFKEGDSLVNIPIEQSYSVIPKPNDAVVSADKMNVVYRGLSNPLTISIPGISSNKVKASAAGLRQVKGTSYILKPGKGKEVAIRVSGTLPDGKPISSTVKFRIKDIPKSMASVRKEVGIVKMPKSSLMKSTIGATLPDFVFDLKFNTTSFEMKVPGQAIVRVRGNKLNAQAKKALLRAKRGDIVTIFNLKIQMQGNSSYKMKTPMPVSIEISN